MFQFIGDIGSGIGSFAGDVIGGAGSFVSNTADFVSRPFMPNNTAPPPPKSVKTSDITAPVNWGNVKSYTDSWLDDPAPLKTTTVPKNNFLSGLGSFAGDVFGEMKDPLVNYAASSATKALYGNQQPSTVQGEPSYQSGPIVPQDSFFIPFLGGKEKEQQYTMSPYGQTANAGIGIVPVILIAGAALIFLGSKK